MADEPPMDWLKRSYMIGGFCALLTGFVQAAEKTGIAGIAGKARLAVWIEDPYLKKTLYRIRVNPLPDFYGPAGANRGGFKWIEEQREGVSWITRGIVNSQKEWVARGWRQLDWGLGHQDSDGGFTCDDAFHSTSFFVEALARACIVDPAGAHSARVDALGRACLWLMKPDVKAQGAQARRLFAHRDFILAAAFAQVCFVTGNPSFFLEAQTYAASGMDRQRSDGTNPERDGFDAGYQMIGTVMAFRYLSVLAPGPHRDRVKNFITASIGREEKAFRPDGSVDGSGSTRIGVEIGRVNIVKTPPYAEIFEALIYGGIEMKRKDWRDYAEKLALKNDWVELPPKRRP